MNEQEHWSDARYADLYNIVGAEIGGESQETLTYEELETARQSAQDTALAVFPEIEAPELFRTLDEIASIEFGIRW